MSSIAINYLISVNPEASQLLDTFLSCPAAAELVSTKMSQLDSPLFKGFSHLSVEVSDVNVESELIKGRIKISQQDVNTPKGKSELIRQILQHTGGHKPEVIQEAIKGNMNVDQFAHKMEHANYLDDTAHDVVIAKCAKFWGIKKSEIAPYSLINSAEHKSGDLELRIWTADLLGASDIYRTLWIDSIKTIYCKQHPDDHKSCELNKKDLILNDYKGEASSKHVEKIAKRVCDNYLDAPQKVQRNLEYVVKVYCPSILSLVRLNVTEPEKQEL